MTDLDDAKRTEADARGTVFDEFELAVEALTPYSDEGFLKAFDAYAEEVDA